MYNNYLCYYGSYYDRSSTMKIKTRKNSTSHNIHWCLLLRFKNTKNSMRKFGRKFLNKYYNIDIFPFIWQLSILWNNKKYLQMITILTKLFEKTFYKNNIYVYRCVCVYLIIARYTCVGKCYHYNTQTNIVYYYTSYRQKCYKVSL